MYASIVRAPTTRALSLPKSHAVHFRRSSFFPQSYRLHAPALTAEVASERRLFTEVTAKIKVGNKLEDYPEYFKKVKASSGSSISLSSFKGRQPVVLFFYPRAGTPGCTKQAQTFRDEYNELKKLKAAVFGISGDTLDEQKSFASAQNLPYPLLVDEGNELRKGFGIPSDLFGALPGRQTIVIDKTGTCILSYNNQLDPASHAKEAIKALSKS